MVIARTCPDEQPLPMDAEARQEKLRYTQLHAQIKWTSAPIMDIEHRVSVANTDGRVAPKLIEDSSQSFEPLVK